MMDFTVVDATGTVHQVPLPRDVRDLTIRTDSDGTHIDSTLGSWWLSFEPDGPRWDFRPAPWVLRIERLNVLRRDVLAFLDAAGVEGRALAERVRKEHW